MNSLLVGVSLLVFVSSVVFGIYKGAMGILPSSEEISQEEENYKEVSEGDQKKEETVVLGEELFTENDFENAKEVTKEVTNESEKSSNNTLFLFQDYIYPGSTIKAEEEKSLTLVSSDLPDVVTSWYEEKIKADGFNIKTFIRTKTNEHVENLINGIKGDLSIEIKITVEENFSTISVNTV